ncbi:type II secretion system protein [bacterium]|nr:MAG: type II secretion system protein [bacterium]
MQFKKHDKRGFTLIELIMVIVIVGTLTGISSMYIQQIIDLWSSLSFRSEFVNEARSAISRMAREMRNMKLRTQAYEPITLANASALTFVDSNNNNISYSLSGTNLMRNSNILASSISSLQFCYYNSVNSAVCSPVCGCNVASADFPDIYRIGIKIDISSGGQAKHLESQVYPRNLH